MTIGELVESEKEQPEYQEELRSCYDFYISQSPEELTLFLEIVRSNIRFKGPTHSNVAACVILNGLINGNISKE